MKAITIWQPWASLLACGAKEYETRSWATKYRGPIAIHAAKTNVHKTMIELPTSVSMAIYNSMYEKLEIRSGVLERMHTSCIIATAELIACWPIYQTYYNDRDDPYVMKENQSHFIEVDITQKEQLFGDFTSGCYAWEFANMKMLDKPIPARGGQRIWNWDDGGKG